MRLPFVFLERSTELLADLDESGFEVPTRGTLSRNTIKLAAASCMHARTKNASDDRPVTRYINPDGSPKGRELYLMKYWEIRGHDYLNCPVQKAPCMTLSQSHAGVMDRGMCQMHVAYLLNGPTAEGMRAWGESMYGYLGDLGESRCPNIPDLTDIYLYGDSPERRTALVGTYFYPNAIPITGPSHLLDWCLYQTLCRRSPLSAADAILGSRRSSRHLPHRRRRRRRHRL